MSGDVILYCEDPFGQGCSWSGDEGELVATDSDPDNFSHCPNCGGDEFYEEDDFDDEDEDDEDDDEDDDDEDEDTDTKC